jgi:hypothetical protein
MKDLYSTANPGAKATSRIVDKYTISPVLGVVLNISCFVSVKLNDRRDHLANSFVPPNGVVDMTSIRLKGRFAS